MCKDCNLVCVRKEFPKSFQLLAASLVNLDERLVQKHEDEDFVLGFFSRKLNAPDQIDLFRNGNNGIETVVGNMEIVQPRDRDNLRSESK